MKIGYACFYEDIEGELPYGNTNELTEIEKDYQEFMCQLEYFELDLDCGKIFSDSIENSRNETTDRPHLRCLINSVQSNDIVIVYNLGMFGRNLNQMCKYINELSSKGAFIISLHEPWDEDTEYRKRIFAIRPAFMHNPNFLLIS